MLMSINLTVATYSKSICSVFRDWFVVLELKDNQIVTYLICHSNVLVIVHRAQVQVSVLG